MLYSLRTLICLSERLSRDERVVLESSLFFGVQMRLSVLKGLLVYINIIISIRSNSDSYPSQVWRDLDTQYQMLRTRDEWAHLVAFDVSPTTTSKSTKRTSSSSTATMALSSICHDFVFRENFGKCLSSNPLDHAQSHAIKEAFTT